MALKEHLYSNNLKVGKVDPVPAEVLKPLSNVLERTLPLVRSSRLLKKVVSFNKSCKTDNRKFAGTPKGVSIGAGSAGYKHSTTMWLWAEASPLALDQYTTPKILSKRVTVQCSR